MNYMEKLMLLKLKHKDILSYIKQLDYANNLVETIGALL